MPEAPRIWRAVLVTGEAGFVGSHLTDRLLELGSRVTVLDDLSNGRVGNLSVDHPNLAFERNVGHSTAPLVSERVRDADLVVHLASPVGVGRAHRDPKGTTRRMLGSGRVIVDACRTTGTPMLLTSSSEVYGFGGDEPLSESAPIATGVEPRWNYAAAKLELERLVGSLARDAVTGWVVRLFNIVGARQRATTGHVLPSFCVAAADGRPLVIHGDGQASRTFLHVADAVDAVLAVVSTPALARGPVNVGGGSRLTITDLADLVIQRARSSSTKIFVDEASVFGADFAAVRARVPDTTKLRVHPGWQPSRTVIAAIDDRLQEANRPPQRHRSAGSSRRVSSQAAFRSAGAKLASIELRASRANPSRSSPHQSQARSYSEIRSVWNIGGSSVPSVTTMPASIIVGRGCSAALSTACSARFEPGHTSQGMARSTRIATASGSVITPMPCWIRVARNSSTANLTSSGPPCSAAWATPGRPSERACS